MTLRITLTTIVLSSLSLSLFAGGKGTANEDSLKQLQLLDLTELLPDDPILQAMDSMLSESFFLASGQETIFYDSAEVAVCHDSIVPMEAELIKKRLAELDEQTPFNLVYNDRVHAFHQPLLEQKASSIIEGDGTCCLLLPTF